MKIVIPMAGFGARLRPHTWSKPKQLIEVAGQPFLNHVLAMLDSLPQTMPREVIFVTGYRGDQIRAYTDEAFPHLAIQYEEQRELLGQSHAIYQARRHIEGPLLMVFADTLVETDLGFLARESAEAVAWVREVADPRRFGVAQLDTVGRVNRIIEKPQSVENRLAVVGFYYFADGPALIDAIEEQLVRDIQVRGEYFLADAVNILLGRGLNMRTEPVSTWLDAGTAASTLETNAYLLEHGYANHSRPSDSDGVTVIPPVYIAPSAQVEESVIGPQVSIGPGCRIASTVLRNTIVERDAVLVGCELADSIVGSRSGLQGVKGIISVGGDSRLDVTNHIENPLEEDRQHGDRR